MAYTKGSYPLLNGGVSQQAVHARLPNQVTEQVNMLSDLVTGPRRRGGTRLIREHDVSSNLKTEVISVGGQVVLILVEYTTGRVIVTVADTYQEENIIVDVTVPYCVANSASSIRFTRHGNRLYILNTEQVVEEGTPVAEVGVDPRYQGYFYVNTGALGTTYDVIVDANGESYSVSHTTPDVDATKATPTYISTELVTLLRNHSAVGTAKGYNWTQLGPYIHVVAPRDVRISTSMGSHMVQVSNSSNVKDTAALPAKLPVEADGYVVRIGYGRGSQYFKWDYADAAWKERAAWGQEVPLVNLPVYIDGDTYSLEETVAAGRLAGDYENSPDPHFLNRSLTGLGSFQGRLLYLCGEYLTFSASGDPNRLYRATMASTLDDDPIEIASTTSQGVVFEYAIPYNGDLLVTSENVQGIVPGRSVLTPKTAVISIASQYKMQSGGLPSSTGKSILYPAQASQGYSALWEITPSEYTEQQVQAHNITEHLPKYIVGDVRAVTTSRTTGIAVILDSTNILKIHQFLWEGSEKRHTAFHTWDMADAIIGVHLQVNFLYIITQTASGSVRVVEWDIVAGLGDEWKYVPKLDNYTVHEGNRDRKSVV